MLLQIVSVLSFLATAAIGTPAPVDRRAASSFRVTYLSVYQNTQKVDQSTSVSFEIKIQDVNAGPVNFCTVD